MFYNKKPVGQIIQLAKISPCKKPKIGYQWVTTPSIDIILTVADNTSVISEADQLWVEPIKEYIQSKIDKEFDNTSLAQTFNQSKQQFSKAPSDYFQ